MLRRLDTRIASLRVVILITLIATSSYARHADYLKGGTGLLFADTHSFRNMGESAFNYGLTLQVAEDIDKTVSKQNAMTMKSAAVFARRNYAVGALYNQSYSGLMSGEELETKAGGGIAWTSWFGKVSNGIGFNTIISDTQAATNIFGTMTAHFGYPDRFKGVVAGLSINQELETDLSSTSISAAVGYCFSRHWGYELDFSLNDFYDPSDWQIGAHYVRPGIKSYLGAGVVFHARDGYADLATRLGYLLWKKRIDVSLNINFPTSSLGNSSYGVALRTGF